MSQDEDRYFHLDRRARSFRPSDFGLGDVPWIVISTVVVLGVAAGLGYVFDRVSQLLPLNVRLITIGFAVGFLVGLRVSAWATHRTTLAMIPLSDRVKEIARDPARKIEAIKVHREETGVGLAEAKVAVEAYFRTLTRD